MRVKFIDIDGYQTRVLYEGKQEASPLLLIHGRAMCSEVWLRNLDHLGTNFFAVAPDVLGNGFTGPADFATGTEPAIGQRLRHLACLVDTLGWDRFSVCGSSHGALLASLLYLQMPHRVSKLVLSGSAACASPDTELKKLMENALKSGDNIGSLSLQEWTQRCAKTCYDPSAVAPELPAALVTAYAKPWVAKAWRDSALSQMNVEGLQDYRVYDRFDQMKAETLVLWGMQDRGAPYEYGQRMVHAMPHATLSSYDKCAHMPMMEHPSRFNEEVCQFLRD